jgi:hypothetical protein
MSAILLADDEEDAVVFVSFFATDTAGAADGGSFKICSMVTSSYRLFFCGRFRPSYLKVMVFAKGTFMPHTPLFLAWHHVF